MSQSLPTTSHHDSTIAALMGLLQQSELREGVSDGHQAFFDEYDDNDEQWTVDELTALVEEGSLTSGGMEKTIVQAYLLDKWVEGGVRPVRVDWEEVAQNREHLGRNMFYYGLGFLLGFIDQGLRPTED